VRIVALAVVVVLGLTGTADARRGVVVVTSGSDVFHIRDIPADQAEGQAGWMLGYRYNYWGLFWLDLSRSDGRFVIYRDGRSLPVTDEELAQLGGASVPWKYQLPLGWIVLVALIEVALVTRSRRRVGVVLVIAGIMSVVALVFLFLGLVPEVVVPLALVGHHVVGSLLAIRLQKRLDAASNPRGRELLADDEPVPPEPEPELRRDFPLPSPPRVETDPFRAPPMARPVVTERPAERPSTAPIVHDATAEPPKLLR
jgi:hypothetical protein